MTIRKLIEKGATKLEKHQVANAKNEARILMCYLLKFSGSELFLSMDEPINAERIKEYLILIDKRCKGQPLQHITGMQEFMGITFKVSDKVLIPRRETEELVERLLKIIGNKDCTVLDLCTGSGAIGISLGKLSKAKVLCSDFSEDALKIAKENIISNDVSENVKLIHSNMFENIRGEFDIIVSNPPYIRTRDIEELETEVKEHEPIIALDGGEDGLKYYRVIINEAFKYLKKGGLLAMEIGYDQGSEVRNIIRENPNYGEATIIKDFSGKDRIVKVNKQEA